MSRYLTGVCAAVLLSCGAQVDPSGPLVQVGDQQITAADLSAYRAALPDELEPAEEGPAGVRDLLQSLVISRLLVLEAEARGYQRDPQVLERFEQLQVERLVREMTDREIKPRVRVTEEDLRRAYRQDHWNTVHRPAHILSETEEEARQVVRALQAGRDFAELARQRSRWKQDAAQGGDLGRYFGPGDVVPELGAAVLDLKKGEYTTLPVRTLHGWEVVKVVDTREVPFEAVQGKISEALHGRRFVEERRRYVEELEEKYGVAFHPQGLQAIMTHHPGDEPVLTIGGQSTLTADSPACRRGLRGLPPDALEDSLLVVRMLRDRLVADSLLVREARQKGLDQAPEFVAFRKRTYERLLAGHLRKKEVVEEIEIPEEEVRQLYEQRKQEFRIPENYVMTEVLLDSEAEAARIRDQVKAGADMAQLARTSSRRPAALQNGGHLEVGDTNREKWPKLWEALRGARVGDVVGPVAVEGGYSVVRVREHVEPTVRPYEQVANVVRFWVRRQRADAAFEEFARSLMQRYQDRVRWFDERIEAVAAAQA
ncbi:MAG: peptidylprolyl isomerase [Candidatus Latescibacterota bacterium]